MKSFSLPALYTRHRRSSFFRADAWLRLPLRRWLTADGIVSLACLAGGLLFALLCMDAGCARDMVTAHLPADDLAPIRCWIRITLTLLPGWLLFGLAGLCCLGGSVCFGVLAVRGLCDGAAWGTLILAGADPVPFAVRTILLLAVRLGLALWCRATAGDVSDPAWQNPSGTHGLSPLMRRHLAGMLASGAAGAAVCVLYTALLYI